MLDRSKAQCVGKTNIFFNERSIKDQRQAKIICRQCSMIKDCRDYAINNNVFFGVWGGMSSKEIARQRHILGVVLPPDYRKARSQRGKNAKK